MGKTRHAPAYDLEKVKGLVSKGLYVLASRPRSFLANRYGRTALTTRSAGCSRV